MSLTCVVLCSTIRGRTQEETLQQERCAGREAWDLAKNVHKLNDKDKTTFFSPSEVWSSPAPSSKKKKKPEDRQFVVDSLASRHMLSRKDQNSAELETIRVSQPMEKCKHMRKQHDTFTTLTTS